MNYVFFCSNDRKFSPQEIDHLQRSSPVDFKEADRFLRWEDQQAFMLGRLLLLWGCKKLGIANASLKAISFDKNKRPYLPIGIDFNISHSGKFVVCAISDSERVGVDVECIRNVDIAEFSDYFSETEYAVITQAANPFAQFFHYWTLKEAAIKGDGRGLGVPLSSVTIQGDIVQVEGVNWYAQPIVLDLYHPAHVVSNNPASVFLNEYVMIHELI